MKLIYLQVIFFLTFLQALTVFSAAVTLHQELTLDVARVQELLQHGAFDNNYPGYGAVGQRSSSSVKRVPFLFTGCRPPWVFVGDGCLFADLSKDTTWQEGRNFCKELYKGADLVTFKDANEFAETLHYLKSLNSANKLIDFWFGGSELNQNGEWLWITGEPMPTGSPFWGDFGIGKPEPVNSDAHHCGLLYQRDRYFLHDTDCNGVKGQHMSPLCQYRPYA